MILDAAADAATLKHLCHYAHSTENAATASADGRVQATHVVLMGMSEQDSFNHLTANAIALQFDKGLVQRGNILALRVFLLAMVLDWFADACIDENAATGCSQVGTVAAASAAEAHKAQPLAHTRILRCGRLNNLNGIQAMGCVVTVHVKRYLERTSIVGISFILVACHIVRLNYRYNRKMVGILW